MSFDYDKISKKDHDHGSWWTSYADLFMMLSIVFLLMFVASSLRNGSAGFQQQTEYRKLAHRAEDLEQQIKAYNTLKDEALRKQNNQAEQQVYEKLLDKLSLLKDEAHGEKERLEAAARENSDKEFALNQYQQLVRNMINANILAKSQIQHRDEVIVKRDATIEEKQKIIAEMEATVAQNEAQIASIHSQLDQQIALLRQEQVRSKSSKAALEDRIAKLRQSSEARVQALSAKNENISQELGKVRENLTATSAQLGDTRARLTDAHATIEQKEGEKAQLSAKLAADRARYQDELDGLKQAHGAKLAKERAAFEAGLRKQRLSAAARAKKLASFLAGAEKRAGDMEGRLAGLRGKIKETEAKLAGTEAANENLKGDLERTRAIANARQRLASQLASNFALAGVKGAVDPKSGEVTLDFGDEYFDTGSTNLKPKMRSALDQFIPLYAKSLFSDPKTAGRIANVEIIGFASSTYQGRYVNPKSMRAEDREAIEYNLKLSFGRANSIFSHVLNQNRLPKEDRERLMPLMKVVGRGYLPEGRGPAEIPDGLTEQQFCARYNCKKAQKVVVKFTMKD